MEIKSSKSDFRPMATPQGWFSWNAWSFFFANIFDSMSRFLTGSPKPLSNVVPLPITVTPETITTYLETNFTPNIKLAEREVEQKHFTQAGRVLDVLRRMKEDIERAIKEDPLVAEHDYVLITSELAKVETLAKRLVGFLPTYPTVPHVDPDPRVLPSFGLTNGGRNNCFINTILQIVFVVPELVQHIVFAAGQHLTVLELYQEYKKVQENGALFTSPNLASSLRKLCPQFEGIEQHDSFEFLLKVLIDPLKNPKENPLFFNFEERSYYHDYEKYRDQITDRFEEDGGRIPSKKPDPLDDKDGRGIKPREQERHSSLQLVLSSAFPLSTMEELIQRSLHEEIPLNPKGPQVEFRCRESEKPVRLKLARKHVKVSPPPFLFVDFKRHSVTSQQFRDGGIFRGAKNTTPIAFTQTFFIPPEFDLAGKGAKYEWVALVNGGGFGGGHYVADVRASNGKYYEYSDSSAHEISEQNFLAAGNGCYGGFARRVHCEDIEGEMQELHKGTETDREIGAAVYGKWGDRKELDLIELFNTYLEEEVCSLVKLQKVYDKLSPDFHRFVTRFFPEDPRDHLVELKGITKPLLVQAEEEDVATHIVAQYAHVRKQNLALARNHRSQIERDLDSVQKQKALLEHLLTLKETPEEQIFAAAILDPGLEKLISIKEIERLLEENALEQQVLEIKQTNADIRARKTL